MKTFVPINSHGRKWSGGGFALTKGPGCRLMFRMRVWMLMLLVLPGVVFARERLVYDTLEVARSTGVGS